MVVAVVLVDVHPIIITWLIIIQLLPHLLATMDMVISDVSEEEVVEVEEEDEEILFFIRNIKEREMVDRWELSEFLKASPAEDPIEKKTEEDSESLREKLQTKRRRRRNLLREFTETIHCPGEFTK